MKVNFSELLASERVRPLWGRSYTQETAMDELQRILTPAPQGSEPADGALPTPGIGSGGAPDGTPRAVSDRTGPVRGAAPGGESDARSGQRDAASGALPRAAAAGTSATQASSSAAQRGAAPVAAFVPPTDLADVPIRAPHKIFEDLEQAVRNDLGSRASMVRNYIEALRVRVHSLDPTAPDALYHPMRHAASGSIWELLSRMEDTLSGLRRVAAKR